jgi:hypothetical protein
VCRFQLGHALALAGLLLGGLGACSLGDGTGQVEGAIFIRSCAKRTSVGASGSQTAYSFGSADDPVMYQMYPSFFAAEPINDFPRLTPNNRLVVREQSDGSRIEAADVLIVNVANVYQVATALNMPIDVGVNTNVRATLSLNQSCPMPEALPELEGTMTFSQFGDANLGRPPIDFQIGKGDRLQATFDFNVVDVRAASIGGIGNVPVDPAVGGHITGNFDFIVRQGQRAQSYP